MDPTALDRIRTRVESDIAAERYDGARLIVAHRGVRVLDLTLGFAERDAGRAMAGDDLFNIMSIQKAMTAILVMQRIERGEISLLTPVAEVIPEFAARRKDRVTIGHLLTHTSGLTPGYAPLPVDRLGNLEEAVAAICTLPLVSTPGEQVSYSVAMGFTMLAEVVRRLDGSRHSFRQMLREDLFTPLGMHDTTMGLPAALAPRRVPVVIRDPDAPEISPVVIARDEAVTESTELPSGGSTFASADDILLLAEALRQGGRLGDARVLSPAAVRLMTSNQTGHMPNSMMESSRALHGMPAFPAYLGLGLFLRGEGVFPSHMPVFACNGTYGGWGLGSMAFWVCPRDEVSFVMLTAGIMERIRNLLRFQRIGDMALAAVVD